MMDRDFGIPDGYERWDEYRPPWDADAKAWRISDPKPKGPNPLELIGYTFAVGLFFFGLFIVLLAFGG